ncbi:sporulation-induced protein [Teratosphaeriaceae sp. CCFEE 6253]|nr:sporulation-induced protein [Teratosphaeriaceae sp. CCFEE 6253]
MRFVEHHVVPTILDFFFRFPWNNFLHNVVYDVVQQVFNGVLDRGHNRAVALALFAPIIPASPSSSSSSSPASPPDSTLGLLSTKPITARILDGQAASDASQKERGMRLGYMGHLTLIAEEVCKFGARLASPAGAGGVGDREDEAGVREGVGAREWGVYVEGMLAETRERDNAVLGGVRPENAVGMRNAGGVGGGFAGNGGGGGGAAPLNTGLASAGIGAGAAASNSNNNAQDALAMSEGTVGQAFEINSGTMLSGFGDGEDDDDDDDGDGDEMMGRGGRPAGPARTHSAFDDDEQTDESAHPDPAASTIPPPLNIPPSRARRQLAARLAQKQKEAEADGDPDAADGEAVELAERMPEEGFGHGGGGLPGADEDGEGEGDGGLQITGLRTGLVARGSASRFSGLFGSESSSSGEDEDEDEDADGDEGGFDGDGAGRDETAARPEGDYEDPSASGGGGGAGRRRKLRTEDRRPSTTTVAAERKPLDDGDEDEEDGGDDGVLDAAMRGQMHLGGEGPFADPVEIGADDDDDDDDDSDGELVEIRPRRTS